MILLSQKIGQGKTHVCSARCYNAKSGDCSCICGGRNHGVGVTKALDNVRTMFAPLVLCEHDKILGTCPEGCTKAKGRVGDVEVTNRALRQMRRLEEEAHAS